MHVSGDTASLGVQTQGEGGHLQAEEARHTETHPADALILDFWSPEL